MTIVVFGVLRVNIIFTYKGRFPERNKNDDDVLVLYIPLDII